MLRGRPVHVWRSNFPPLSHPIKTSLHVTAWKPIDDVSKRIFQSSRPTHPILCSRQMTQPQFETQNCTKSPITEHPLIPRPQTSTPHDAPPHAPIHDATHAPFGSTSSILTCQRTGSGSAWMTRRTGSLSLATGAMLHYKGIMERSRRAPRATASGRYHRPLRPLTRLCRPRGGPRRPGARHRMTRRQAR